MDIVAHGLWAAAALVAARRRRHVPASTAALAVTMAVVPDIVQLLPLLTTMTFDAGGMRILNAYVTAVPGAEPRLAPTTWTLVHHLHCAMHSALVAGAVTAVIWAWTRRLWLPLLGWWSHIGIDVFTHSADFYPSPVLYPLTERGFDGVAWNEPWFMAANYVALGLVFGWLLLSRPRATSG